MDDLRAFVLVAGVAALCTYLLTPPVRLLAIRIGAVDQPGGRKMHARVTPTAGGLAMLAAFLAGLAVASRLDAFAPLFSALRVPGAWPGVVVSEVIGVAIGAILMAAIGVVDDIWGLSAPAKLAAQVFAASVMTLAGVQVLYFWLPGQGMVSLSPDLGVPLTVALIVVTVNAVNLVDGLDGLAAGLVGIGALAYFIYSFRTGPTGLIAEASAAALIAALTVGVCAGFLPHNFNPARIFMGDAGAMMLGSVLAGASVVGIGRTGEPRAADQFALLIPVAIPLLVLALPFIDTLFAVGRRLRAGSGVMNADKNHLHYRLLEIGHSHRKAVLVLWGWSALLASTVVAASFAGARRTLPVLLVLIGSGILVLLGPARRPRQPRA